MPTQTESDAEPPFPPAKALENALKTTKQCAIARAIGVTDSAVTEAKPHLKTILKIADHFDFHLVPKALRCYDAREVEALETLFKSSFTGITPVDMAKGL